MTGLHNCPTSTAANFLHRFTHTTTPLPDLTAAVKVPCESSTRERCADSAYMPGDASIPLTYAAILNSEITVVFRRVPGTSALRRVDEPIPRRGRNRSLRCRSRASLLALPVAHIPVPDRVPDIASSRGAGRPKATEADLAHHQAARTPDADAMRPRHNAGVMVAAALGRSPVWGRSVAGQLWSPWDVPRGNRRECRRVGSWPVVVPLGCTQGKPEGVSAGR